MVDLSTHALEPVSLPTLLLQISPDVFQMPMQEQRLYILRLVHAVGNARLPVSALRYPNDDVHDYTIDPKDALHKNLYRTSRLLQST